jgi:RNA polymerase sigma factor (sigma-70 family)
MSMHFTDEDLMVAVREGDVHQIEVLFERYREQLYDFFGRLTGDRGISEDLVQDVFVRILKYRSSYRETNRFVTWMYQIARNSRIDYFKKHKAEPADSLPFTAAVSTPARQLEESEEKALLQRALMQINESNRELLVLLRYQEMNYEDIAGLLGIQVNAVRTRVHRAMKELRDVFMKLKAKEPPCSATKPETTLPTT